MQDITHAKEAVEWLAQHMEKTQSVSGDVNVLQGGHLKEKTTK